MNPVFALAEVVWILRGRNDAAFLTAWNRSLSAYAGPEPVLHGSYGFRLRTHFGIDQLARATEALSKNPASRQVVLQVWDSKVDLPSPDGVPVSKDIPCNVLACLKVVDGRLEWLQVVRSNDIFRGLPYNLVQWTTMQELLSGWLGVKVGSYNQVSDSLHLYERDVPIVGTDSELEANNTDSVAMPRQQCEEEMRCLEACIEKLAARGTAAIDEVTRMGGISGPLRNWLMMFCAEQHRRAKEDALAMQAIRECTNPALVLAWMRWAARLSSADSKNAEVSS
jgi:thymidylate synthase